MEKLIAHFGWRSLGPKVRKTEVAASCNINVCVHFMPPLGISHEFDR